MKGGERVSETHNSAIIHFSFDTPFHRASNLPSPQINSEHHRARDDNQDLSSHKKSRKRRTKWRASSSTTSAVTTWNLLREFCVFLSPLQHSQLSLNTKKTIEKAGREEEEGGKIYVPGLLCLGQCLIMRVVATRKKARRAGLTVNDIYELFAEALMQLFAAHDYHVRITKLSPRTFNFSQL